jgi:hypothetical protein
MPGAVSWLVKFKQVVQEARVNLHEIGFACRDLRSDAISCL